MTSDSPSVRIWIIIIAAIFLANAMMLVASAVLRHNILDGILALPTVFVGTALPFGGRVVRRMALVLAGLFFGLATFQIMAAILVERMDLLSPVHLFQAIFMGWAFYYLLRHR